MQSAPKSNAVAKVARRVLKQRDTDEVADRAIKEHFPKFTSFDTDVRLVHALALREQFPKDIRDSRMSKSRLTTTHYDTMHADVLPDHLKEQRH